jgi:hypothetical protein
MSIAGSSTTAVAVGAGVGVAELPQATTKSATITNSEKIVRRFISKSSLIFSYTIYRLELPQLSNLIRLYHNIDKCQAKY